MAKEQPEETPPTVIVPTDHFTKGARAARFVVGFLVALLATIVLASAVVAYIARLAWCDQVADRWGSPLIWLVQNPPSWPLVVLLLSTVALIIFFGPIESFLSRLRKGPFGISAGPHQPSSSSVLPTPPSRGAPTLIGPQPAPPATAPAPPVVTLPAPPVVTLPAPPVPTPEQELPAKAEPAEPTPAAAVPDSPAKE